MSAGTTGPGTGSSGSAGAGPGVPLQRVDLATLDETWNRRPGISGWLGQCNHKTVGRRFIFTSLAMFLVAGLLALLMRSQLAAAEADVVSPEGFNELFTMHGTLMMFFFAVPMLEGLIIYFLPLQIGARDMPMPRVNAFGYWLYLAGVILLLSSFFFGAVPDGGWYAYPPLTTLDFSPGAGLDFWLLGVTLTEISAIVASFEIITLALRSRAPGMSLARMPLFGWASLATATMILVAFTPLVIASLLLEIERKLSTPFFDGGLGGDPFLWQHLFWWFGHPEVYIQLLPALGIVATVIPVVTRRRPPMRWLLVASFLAIAIVSFGLWVHHMFTVGIPQVALQFFSAASFMITIPSGVAVLSFIAAIWVGRLDFDPPSLFALGFLVIFVFGGITGVMVAVVAFNHQIHDTYFVVGHFHSVLIGGVVFPIFAGLYHWFPKLTGRHLSRTAGIVSFWLMLLGFLLTFVPQHVLGFLGMPRRVWTYEEGLGWEGWNLVGSLGSGLLGLGVAVSVVAFVVGYFRGPLAGPDPWGAPTLEWAIPSPPPQENFSTVPTVSDAEPRWGPQDRPDPIEVSDWYADLGTPPPGQREAVLTSVVHGRPQTIAILPGHSLWPLWLATAILVVLVGVLLDLHLVAWLGVVGVVVALTGWLWPWDRPDYRDGEPVPPATPADRPAAPTAGVRTFRRITDEGRSIGWWGAVLGVVALAHLVAAVLVAALYLRAGSATWPPTAIEPPGVPEAGIAAGLAIVAALAATVADRRTRAARAGAPVALGLVTLLAAGAAALRAAPTVFGGHPVDEHAFWAIWWLLGATDMVIMASLALVALVAAAHTVRGSIRPGRHAELSVVRLWGWATAVAVVLGFVVSATVTSWWG